jgi:energy-coupling factor transporter ATP-binding protein EcfA2
VKLKKLKIKKYKNLIDFEANFEFGQGLSIFIGNNGSGKSNVLEAISGIFANAYSAKAIHKFVYSLTYEIKGKEVKLEQTVYRRQYFVDGKVVAIKELAALGLLPTNVIALYSGEDKRWWHNYYEPFYFKFTRDINAGTGNNLSPKMYYINKYYWDIALLSLIYSTAEDDKQFLRETIGRDTVDHILLFYTQNVERNCKSELLKSFLQSVNLFSEHSKGPDGEPMYLYVMTKENIFDTYGVRVFEDFAALKNFYMFVDAKFLNSKPEEFNYYEKQLFDYFVQAYMPKDKKVIKNIELIYNGFSAKDLSEGEKKLILIRSVLSFVADENSLILFDEPDANIHEGRKQQLYNLFSEYCKFDRQMIVTTHSPILAQLAKEKELLMLELDEGKSTILTDEKIEKIKKLSGTSWDVIGQGMMLRSSRPLVVFEGKTDVMYVKRALEMLKSRSNDYATLNVDFLNANGAGNVKSFIDNLKSFVPDSKKIIIFFDRDNAGKDGAKAVTGISRDDEKVVHYQDIVQNNITTSFIPYKTGVTDGDFLIEDYFSWDSTIKAIVEDVIPERKHPIKMLPNLPDKIKKELEKRINQFEADEFNGFIPLLDKIVELTKEQAV